MTDPSAPVPGPDAPAGLPPRAQPALPVESPVSPRPGSQPPDVPVPAPQPVPTPPPPRALVGWQPPSDWAPPGRIEVDEANQLSPAVGPDAVVAPGRRRGRIPTALRALLIGVAALALLITGTWLAGGFEQRNSLELAAPDQPLDVGPITVTFHRAWSTANGVDALATCELTDITASSLTTYALSNATDAAVKIDGVAVDSESTLLKLGVDRGSEFGAGFEHARDTLSPGLQPLPCLFSFGFPYGERGDTLAIGMLKLEFVDLSNVRNEHSENRSWERSNEGYLLTIPITEAR